jgi:hypothetical protein
MTAPTMSLHKKLAEVMAEAERIPKNGTAPPQMGGFKFVQVGDAADAIRKALGSRGVSMLPSAVEIVSESEHETSSGKAMTTLTVRTTWTLVDGSTGETATIQSLGAGADTGDKAAPKAQSNAMKYALLMGFLLSTGDDPEQTDTSDRAARTSEPRLELLGNLQKVGVLQKGTASGFDGQWRDGQDGHQIGFRFKLDGEDRDIPQLIIKGTIGEALHVMGEALMGARVTVKGKLYGVHQQGRQTYYRLVVGEHPAVDFVSTPDWRVPALDTEPVEAPSVPLFDDAEQAKIDAAVDAVLS